MNERWPATVLMTIGLLGGVAPAIETAPVEPSLRAVAERYFRGVYGCNPAVVEELASPDIVVTYPIFATLFGKPALRGRDAVTAFAQRFCRKWADGRFVFHDAMSDERRVVLLWSFSARSAEAESGQASSCGDRRGEHARADGPPGQDRGQVSAGLPNERTRLSDRTAGLRENVTLFSISRDLLVGQCAASVGCRNSRPRRAGHSHQRLLGVTLAVQGRCLATN
jgi:hypothetical protein